MSQIACSLRALYCREAGIGSGTFFHYFPTKDSFLLAILDEGGTYTQEFFAAQEGRTDAVQVLLDWVNQALQDLQDLRATGFIAVDFPARWEPRESST